MQKVKAAFATCCTVIPALQELNLVPYDVAYTVKKNSMLDKKALSITCSTTTSNGIDVTRIFDWGEGRNCMQ